MQDRTHEVIVRQTQAMDTDQFEVGLFKPDARSEMLLRTWDRQTLTQSISWLKFQNADGRNIYIRPKGEHSLSLVDDLTSESLERMKHSGFTPALIIETSPDNFQAWLNHGRILPKEISTAAARELAEKFGGDPGSADWRHFGRLAGFTNRKSRYEIGGRYPYVRLVHSTGKVYEQAGTFLANVEAQVETVRIDAERRREWARNHNKSHPMVGPVKTIDDFRADPKYKGDGNRIDLAYAVYALAHGVSHEDLRSAIASRDLAKKGPEKRQAEYIERTVRKALESVQGVARSR